MEKEEYEKKVVEPIQRKEFVKTLPILENLLKENPNNIVYLLDLGYVYGSLNKFNEAIKCYERVVELVPENESGYAGLGYIYQKKEDYAKALESFRRGLAFAPDKAEIWFEIGQCHFELDQYDDAIHAYEKAIQFGGVETDPETLHGLAQAYLGKGDADKAIKILINLLKGDGSWASAYNLLGVAFYMKGKFEEAIKNFEFYLKSYPNDDAARNLLVKAKEQLKK